MIPAFSNITESGFNLLESILNHPNSLPGDFFFDDPTVDGQLDLLLDSKLASIDSNGILAVTELGRAALKEFDSTKIQAKRKRRWDIMQFVVPTFISLAALAVSIIALLK